MAPAAPFYRLGESTMPKKGWAIYFTTIPQSLILTPRASETLDRKFKLTLTSYKPSKIRVSIKNCAQSRMRTIGLTKIETKIRTGNFSPIPQFSSQKIKYKNYGQSHSLYITIIVIIMQFNNSSSVHKFVELSTDTYDIHISIQ